MGKWNFPQDGHMDKADRIYFQTMNTKELKERLGKDDTIIIPVGSTECHGAHSCFGEDTYLVTRMAELVAQKTGCTVAQPIWYGSHPYQHLGMPGTVIIPEDVFLANLRAVIAGLWNAGFRKQILLNGHGQEYVIPNAIHQFAKRYQVPAVITFVNWPTVIPNYLKDKEHGGPFETPFKHACEVETSYALALFPEMNQMENAIDTKSTSFIKGDHIDKGGDIYQKPIPGHGQIGFGPLELRDTPEGCVGSPTLADPKKAKEGLEVLLDYLVKLHDDILEAFPPGKLPEAKLVTERSEEEINKLLKGPLDGGISIYSIGWPP